MKRVILLIAIGLIASTALWAQIPPSPTSTITGGIFKETEDRYLSPVEYPMIEHTVLFLQFDMPSNGSSGGNFQAGAGTWFGSLYVGGLLDVDHSGKQGDESIDAEIDLLIDDNNQIVGRVEERIVSSDYENSVDDSVSVVIGLGQNLGIYGTVGWTDYTEFGSFAPGYTFPGAATWNTSSVGGVGSATSVTITDTAGTVTNKNSEVYGDGTKNNNEFTFDAGAGITLPLGDSSLQIIGGLGADIGSDSDFGAYQSYTAVPGSDTGASFTPTLGENGEDPVAVAGVTESLYEEAQVAYSYLDLNPSVDARFLYPFSDTVDLEGGWVLDSNFRINTGSYLDTAGTKTNAAGYTSSFYSLSVVREPGGGPASSVETVETRYFQAQDYGYFNIEASLPMTARVTPSERFRFGVQYTPTVEASFYNHSYSGQAVERTTYEDGTTGNTADDYVQVETVTFADYSYSSRQFTLMHQLETAAQFFLVPERLRVNLGAQVSQYPVNRNKTETTTQGIITYQVERADGTTEPTAEELLETTYATNSDVRTYPDFATDLYFNGTSATVDYDAGITFFFDENMYLDLNLDSAGNIWDVNRWSLDMTILQ